MPFFDLCSLTDFLPLQNPHPPASQQPEQQQQQQPIQQPGAGATQKDYVRDNLHWEGPNRIPTKNYVPI